MILKTAIVFIFLLSFSFSNAQIKPVTYKIIASQPHSYNSRYSSIQFLDSRDDTSSLGFLVEYGSYRTPVLPMYVLDEQIFDLFDVLINKTVDRKALVFQLRRLVFHEILNGYCDIRAEIYCKDDTCYKKLALLDTTIEFEHNGKFNNKFQKRLLDACSTAFSNFLGNAITNDPIDSTSYSLGDMVNMENIEKSKIPVYNCKKFTDGFYKTYSSFKQQIPDETNLIVKMDNDKVKVIERTINTNTQIIINPSEIYALVYKGKPYITTEFGCYELTKKGDDFFFMGKEKISKLNTYYSYSIPENLLLHGLSGGISDIGLIGLGVGSVIALATGSKKEMFEIKIDYLNGKHILLKTAEK